MADMIIYGKPTCPHTKRALKAHPEAVFVDILASQDNMDAMLQHSDGVKKIPVIVANGKATIGFKRGC